MDKIVTLDTDIQSDAIPACVCEKSLADKTEKFCLNCSKNMGAIAPWWGVVCGTGYAGWWHYYPLAISKAATDAGMNVIILFLKGLGVKKLIPEICEKISSTGNYANITEFSSHIYIELKATCAATLSSPGANQATSTQICSIVQNVRAGVVSAEQLVSNVVKSFAEKAKLTADAQAAKVTAKYTSTTSSLTTGITASIIAIVVIILIMIIIYLILHYRRKKKMKKKLQYIKLLKE
ncbi:surface antigen [Plasmodium falciparum UGT5.1]|uniref:Surface antigen n=1 Tax=Plasmodium falciparum UGT5.1 TaxID=1237627 RepID=W7J3D6_PLAFA|nr:surface antigen [Plasmodium falciparum UGT5.1]